MKTAVPHCLEISGVSKNFRGEEVLHPMSLKIDKGITGLLGPNGSGKSTLLRVLASILRPDTGSVALDDIDSQKRTEEYRSYVGFLPQKFELFQRLTPYEFLLFIGTLRGLAMETAKYQIEQLSYELNLSEVLSIRDLSNLSGGTVQRVAIAAALMGAPRLILLDEPTAGLDLEERIRFRFLLERVSQRSCVIISTHITQDIELSCSRLLMLRKGSLVCDSDPEKLKQSLIGRIRIVTIPKTDFPAVCQDYPVLSCCDNADGTLRLRLIANHEEEWGEKCAPTIEDAYVSLMKDKKFNDW